MQYVYQQYMARTGLVRPQFQPNFLTFVAFHKFLGYFMYSFRVKNLLGLLNYVIDSGE